MDLISSCKSSVRRFCAKYNLLGAYQLSSDLYVKYLAIKATLRDRGCSSYRRASNPRDGFATTTTLSFLTNDRFIAAFNNSFDEVPERWMPMLRNVDWRAHICTWAASQALALKEGDFVECGVWYGILSKVICEFTSFAQQDRNFFLVDPWGGLKGFHDKWYEDEIFDVVGRRFSQYPNVHLVRGLVPDVLPQIAAKKIAYLSIDMNGSEPERAALEFFYDKIVPGGIIYFDDYGWFPELRATVNQFFADKPENLLHFPGGTSIIIKT